MFPQFPSAQSLIRDISRYARRFRPSRLTYVAAAAFVAVAAIVAGLVAGFSGGPAAAPLAGTVGALGVTARPAPASTAPARTAPASPARTAAAKPAADAARKAASGRRQAAHATRAHSTRSRAAAAPAARSHRPAASQQAPRPQQSHHAAGGHRAARHGRVVGHTGPYLIYDSVTPSAIPAHHEIATYATGGYAVSPSQVAGRRVLWIDTSGTDPAAAALDIEPGDATPSMAATWAWNRLRHAAGNAVAILYTMRSEWPAVQAAVATLPHPMQSRIRYWIADPTGVPHIVPGASATQWYWGSSYDITTASPGFQAATRG